MALEPAEFNTLQPQTMSLSAQFSIPLSQSQELEKQAAGDDAGGDAFVVVAGTGGEDGLLQS
jgi:hypothetical protein